LAKQAINLALKESEGHGGTARRILKQKYAAAVSGEMNSIIVDNDAPAPNITPLPQAPLFSREKPLEDRHEPRNSLELRRSLSEGNVVLKKIIFFLLLISFAQCPRIHLSYFTFYTCI